MNDSNEYIEHVGVLGMHWGVRKSKKTGQRKYAAKAFRKAYRNSEKLRNRNADAKKETERTYEEYKKAKQNVETLIGNHDVATVYDKISRRNLKDARKSLSIAQKELESRKKDYYTAYSLELMGNRKLYKHEQQMKRAFRDVPKDLFTPQELKSVENGRNYVAILSNRPLTDFYKIR